MSHTLIDHLLLIFLLQISLSNLDGLAFIALIIAQKRSHADGDPNSDQPQYSQHPLSSLAHSLPPVRIVPYKRLPSAAPCYTFPLYTHSGKWQGKEAAAGIACGRFMFAINYRDFFRPYMKRE